MSTHSLGRNTAPANPPKDGRVPQARRPARAGESCGPRRRPRRRALRRTWRLIHARWIALAACRLRAFLLPRALSRNPSCAPDRAAPDRAAAFRHGSPPRSPTGCRRDRDRPGRPACRAVPQTSRPSCRRSCASPGFARQPRREFEFVKVGDVRRTDRVQERFPLFLPSREVSVAQREPHAGHPCAREARARATSRTARSHGRTAGPG